MSIRIDIKDNFMDAYNVFDKLARREVKAAARKSINRTLVTLRKESVMLIREQVRIKSSVLKSQYISLERAHGSKLNQMEGSLLFKSKGLALVEFLKGNKNPESQKGVPIKRRPKVKVEFTPGKKFVIKGGFLRNTRSRGLQILRRGSTKGHLHMQTGPSVGQLLLDAKRGIGNELQSRGRVLFEENFRHELTYRLSQTIASSNKGL